MGLEQDWQGQGHIILNTRLKAHFVMHGLPKLTNNHGVAFRLRLPAAAQGVAQAQATRIYYLDAAGNQQHTGSGGFRRRSGEWVSLPGTNDTTIEKLEFADNYSTSDLVDMGWVCYQPARFETLYNTYFPARKHTCQKSSIFANLDLPAAKSSNQVNQICSYKLLGNKI